MVIVLPGFFGVVLNGDHIALAATTHRQWNHLLELRTTLDTLFHDRCTILTRHHVATGFEEHRSLSIGAHETLVDLLPR
uniref:Putative secreted protein n=1 Tax=Anopheles triannulatus TaxID=58253 RepID=A0A2M4B3R6_9DIPT